MNGKERLQAALDHRQPDRVPVDFGGTAVTGMHVSAIHRLRLAVTGDTDWRVKVVDPYQMLGEVDDELRERLGIDVTGVLGQKTMFGFENREWKPFAMSDGTPVLVAGDFNTTTAANGDLLIYPEGDLTAPPSGRMPRGYYFFDTLIRQPPLDEGQLDPTDNTEEFAPFSEEDIAWYRRQAAHLESQGQGGVVLNMPGTAFGDIALVPAPWMKNPKGIRDIEEWYVSTVIRTDYVHAVFERQCEIGLKNLEALIGIFGDQVQAVNLTGTDFGTQRGLFISKESYRELFKPYHKRVNDLVHAKSNWKTFMHSCGAVSDLIPDFIEAGFDILNPVQCSAEGMDARTIKREFGRQITFWGGGANTQQTLPFGTPDEVYRECRERIEIFGEGGGYVFNAIHNVQATTPTENLLAMFRAIRDANN